MKNLFTVKSSQLPYLLTHLITAVLIILLLILQTITATELYKYSSRCRTSYSRCIKSCSHG